MSGLRCVVAQWMLAEGASIIQNEGTILCLLSQSLHHSVAQRTASSEHDSRLTTYDLPLGPEELDGVRYGPLLRPKCSGCASPRKGEIRRHLQLQKHSLT